MTVGAVRHYNGPVVRYCDACGWPYELRGRNRGRALCYLCTRRGVPPQTGLLGNPAPYRLRCDVCGAECRRQRMYHTIVQGRPAPVPASVWWTRCNCRAWWTSEAAA